MELADAKGMETAVASAPGWSSTGGPWVKPADAMKKLTWRTIEVTGPGLQVLHIPDLYRTPGRYQNMPDNGNTEPWFQHIATLAVKLPDAEKSMQEMGARVTSSSGNFTVRQLSNGDFTDAGELKAGADGTCWIAYSFDHPQFIRAITLSGCHRRDQWGSNPPGYDDCLEASDD
jgi:hypothetical protein